RVGLLCNQAHAPFDVVEGDPFDLSCPGYKAVVRAIEYAAYIGAKIIIVHAICTANRGDVYRYNQEYYKSLEPYGKKFGIRIAVENDFERRDGKVLPVLNHPEEFGRFVEELGSDWLVGCIDIGHAAMFHDPAEFLASTKGDAVRALHVHDNDRIEDLHLFPMTGYVDWDGLCRSLKQIGYAGDITMEAIKSFARIPDELMQDSLDYLAKIGRYFMDRIGV
ncbi:MAG: sugar phosphate isomerase/epimerase, partial [Clostridia bacterium]|nr:sugar phosphate isomerase/epimerase [Clostridia bacterium]